MAKILSGWFASYLTNTPLCDSCLTLVEGLRALCALDQEKGSGPEEGSIGSCMQPYLGFHFLLSPDLLLFIFFPHILAVLHGCPLFGLVVVVR